MGAYAVLVHEALHAPLRLQDQARHPSSSDLSRAHAMLYVETASRTIHRAARDTATANWTANVLDDLQATWQFIGRIFEYENDAPPATEE